MYKSVLCSLQHIAYESTYFYSLNREQGMVTDII